ncbi:MAG: hypothetical protein ACD_29C00166G0004 [uncultured bacterium]|nr:MAG: hypothetical protein ACD_29C00166G0004 [uncultured bacterium]
MQSASQSHHYVGIDFSGKINHIHSNGNPYCHVVLRGSKEKSNDDLHSIQQTINTLEKQRLAPRIMIDCSHGNSQKDHHQQLLSLQKIAGYISSGNHAILGVMLESNLVSGKQTWIPHQPLRYGQSITDACIGWEETVAALAMLSESVRLRRENMVSYTV